MSAQNTGSQESTKAGEGPDQNLDAQQSVPSGFPIRLADVLLYECQIKRYAERADKFMAQGAALNVELGKPALHGQILEVPLLLHIKVPTNDDPAWLIDALLIGLFEVLKDTDEQLVEAFVSNSAIPFLWPYAREIVQSLTVRMRVWPLMLPSLDLRNWVQQVGSDTSVSDPSQEAKAE